MSLLPDLSSPKVMAIINVTPDSFFAGSRTSCREEILGRAVKAAAGGASILDIGAYSSRPGADDVSPAEETRRLHSAMEVIRKELPQMPLSIDTFRARVAEEIVTSHGPCIINDISAGSLDPDIIDVASKYSLPYIAMHMRGTPQDMQSHTGYDDITGEIIDYFREKLTMLKERGVENVITDPGFGFAKTTEQNYTLLREMHRLRELGKPILAGISRKGMIYKVLGTTPAEALNGTTALHWECLRQGASILRVHDTKEAVETIRLWKMFSGKGDNSSPVPTEL